MSAPTLVLTACLLVNGAPSDTCKDVSVQLEQALPPTQCSGRFGQVVIAKWVEENPQWWVTRWKCPSPEKQEQVI